MIIIIIIIIITIIIIICEKKGNLKENKVISVVVCNCRTGPKDIPSIDFGCFAIFALKDARE